MQFYKGPAIDYFKNILHSIWIMYCPRCPKKQKQPKNKEVFKKRTNVDIFNLGRSKVKKNLDIVSVVQQLREMQIFMSTMLTHKQRLLMMFQRKLLINESEGSEEENGLEDKDDYHHKIKVDLLSKDKELTMAAKDDMKLIL